MQTESNIHGCANLGQRFQTVPVGFISQPLVRVHARVQSEVFFCLKPRQSNDPDQRIEWEWFSRVGTFQASANPASFFKSRLSAYADLIALRPGLAHFPEKGLGMLIPLIESSKHEARHHPEGKEVGGVGWGSL